MNMSKVTFKVGKGLSIDGTSKRGTLSTTFNHIAKKFGEPTERGNDGAFNEWHIKFKIDNNGQAEEVIATIYDWNAKEDPARAPDEEFTFNIGGKDMYGPYYVHQALGV
jgi:hypothetical protein